MPRDFQRKRVYTAEDRCPAMRAEYVTDIHELRAWVKQITEHRVFLYFYPQYHASGITVLDGRGRSRALGSPRGYIKMPRWTRSKLVVLHEIAHVVSPWTELHGELFCQNYLTLVRYILGEPEHHALQLRMQIEGVRFKPALELPTTA